MPKMIDKKALDPKEGKKKLDEAAGKDYIAVEPKTGLSTRHKKPTFFSGKTYAPFVGIRKPNMTGV